jgi:hypothetical protein
MDTDDYTRSHTTHAYTCSYTHAHVVLQACRLPYGLIVDGMLKDLQDLSYLLSPQDLMAVSHVPGMQTVTQKSSFKTCQHTKMGSNTYARCACMHACMSLITLQHDKVCVITDKS